MALTKNQERKGHLRKEDANPTKKTGRGDGQGAQKKRGATHVDSAPEPRPMRPVPGDNRSYGEVRSTDVPTNRPDDGIASI
jgi:hypothetical protein